MGSTFAAIHLRGASLPALEQLVLERLRADGFVPAPELAEQHEAEARRILLFDDSGWTTFADSAIELDDKQSQAWGKLLSKQLSAPAIAISVFHSDTALVSLYEDGRRLGRVQIPEDGVAGADGHRRIHAAFLAPLAKDAGAKAQLEGEVLADFTFPEETVGRLAAAVGIPRPGTGLRYAWHQPPEGARRLVFRLARDDSFEPRGRVVPPPSGRGVVLSLAAGNSIEAVDGFPLPDQGMIALDATAGQTRSGIVIELTGTGLDLVDIRVLKGWNPKLDGSGQTVIWEQAATREGGTLVFSFPEAQVVAYEPVGFDPALPRDLAMQRWQRALHAQSDGKFIVGFGARGRKAGEGELALVARPLDGSGDPVSAVISLKVRKGPRRPILPPLPDGEAAFGNEARYLEAYGGRDWLVGWLAFDAPYDEVSELLLAAASDLADALLEGSGAKRLAPAITSAGTHPKTKARFQRGGSLRAPAWNAALEHLRREAQVRLDFEGAPLQGGFVELRHQPHGTTVFTPELRLQLTARRPQPPLPPVELEFALPRPQVESARVALGLRLDGWLRKAAQARCLGAHAGPAGAASDLPGHTAYERLSGLVQTPEDATWLRSHVRTPAWRVVVPKGAVAALDQARGSLPVELSALIEITEVPAGALVAAAVEDPFAITDAHRTALETTLVGCVGSRAEAMARGE